MLVYIPEITMDPTIAFTGTDEEIEKLENQEDTCSAAWRKIIENPNFSALGFQHDTDYLVLSHSTDNNGIYRLHARKFHRTGKSPFSANNFLLWQPDSCRNSINDISTLDSRVLFFSTGQTEKRLQKNVNLLLTWLFWYGIMYIVNNKPNTQYRRILS